MSAPGRGCYVCGREGRSRRMKLHLRHLHEAQPGQRVRLPYSGEEATVVKVGEGRVEMYRGARRDVVSFTTFGGDEVTFSRPVGTDTWAPTAEVEVVP